MADTKREISWKTDPTKNEIEIELPTATQYRQKRNFSLGKNVYDDTKSTGQSKINKNNVMLHNLCKKTYNMLHILAFI